MHVQPFTSALYDSICDMHRRNRTVALAYNTTLTAQEWTVLPEIEANPGLSIVEIKHRLHIDQVSSTRLIQGLVKHGVVSQEQSKRDRRFKEIKLTPKGRKLFQTISERSVATFRGALERLPASERSTFIDLFTRFNDALGAGESAQLSLDVPGMTEVRRASRRLGLHSRAMFGAHECSALEWHVFDLLSAPEASSYVVDLAEVLGAPPKTLAALINRLVARKLLKQSINSKDKRFRTIALTPAGRALHQTRRAAAEKLIAQGLTKMSTKELTKFVTLFRAYTGTDRLSQETAVTSSLLLRREKDTNISPILRAFLYQERAKQSLVRSTSSDLLGPESITYVAWLNDAVVAVASFLPTQRKTTWMISHFIWAHTHVQPAIQYTCTRELLEQFALLTGCTTLLAPETEISPALREHVWGSGLKITKDAPPL
jgi:DNA-binding MarR family transcriptional regulator